MRLPLPLASGHLIALDEPSKLRLLEVDLFTGLRNQRRYLGHLDVSVLQHLAICVQLSRMYFADDTGSPDAETDAHVAGHDMHEVYFPDIPRPVTALFPEIKTQEDLWKAVVHQKLGLHWPVPEALDARVRHVDSRAVTVEANAWRHPRAGHFYSHHGGPPTRDERKIGVLVRSASPAALWAMVIGAVRTYTGQDPLPSDEGRVFKVIEYVDAKF